MFPRGAPASAAPRYARLVHLLTLFTLKAPEEGCLLVLRLHPAGPGELGFPNSERSRFVLAVCCIHLPTAAAPKVTQLPNSVWRALPASNLYHAVRARAMPSCNSQKVLHLQSPRVGALCNVYMPSGVPPRPDSCASTRPSKGAQ